MSGRVLVTGGAGFIGSHLAAEYQRAGWDVTVMDNLSRGRKENVPDGVPLIQLDVCSAEARAAVARGRFDVLNLQAAQIDVRVSVQDPAFDAQTNLFGLINLLEGAAEGKIRRVVFASSGGVVYGDPDVVPTPETAPKMPISPYGVSKLSGEHYLRALGTLRGFETVAMRYANVFGPRQDPKSEAGVVSIFISRVLEGKPLTIFGDGEQTRDYVYVGDVARANVAASTASLPANTDHDAIAFNVATATETSVLKLAHTVGEVLGVKSKIEFAPARAGELTRSSLDTGKAKAMLRWEPKVSFNEGLKTVADWFRGGAR
jgi:UDP-glucose 4-epimerase